MIYIGAAIFLIVSAIFLALISKRKAVGVKCEGFPEVPHSPEAGRRNAIRIITICVAFGFIGGAIIRFSLNQQDFMEEKGLYGRLELGKEETIIVLKNQKVVGGMWLSALAVILAASSSLHKKEHIHPRHVMSIFILIPGFIIGLFIMSISPDVLPEKAAQAAIEEISQHYFLVGLIVMILTVFSSWFCWNSGEKKLEKQNIHNRSGAGGSNTCFYDS